jgi:hypothetical protein
MLGVYDIIIHISIPEGLLMFIAIAILVAIS